MPRQMTSTARNQGAKNALICGVGYLVFWVLTAVLFWLVLGQGIFAAVGLAFAVLWAVIAEDATLLVRSKGIFAWFRGALPVPPEHRPAVEELLSKHCSAQAFA